MATIKSFTDLKQSKRLAEILPLESADMKILPFNKREYRIVPINDIAVCNKEDEIYAWSLAALLNIIPKHIKNCNVLRTDISEKDFSIWYDEVGYGVNDKLPDITMECPIDACVKMILKLKELKLI